MKGEIKDKLSAESAALLGYELSIGPRSAVDFSIIDKSGKYLNGSEFMLPFNGPIIGTIAPGDIPKDPNLRLGLHLLPRSSIRLCSLDFELHMRGRSQPLVEQPTILSGNFGPVDDSIRAAFEEGLDIDNPDFAQELAYSLRVFNVVNLPREFVLRCPDVEYGGLRFRVRDFAFKYFPDRRAIGLCS